jgi:amino acid transporter
MRDVSNGGSGAIAVIETPEHNYGLKQHVLSPTQTLAQSISTIAPITTPAITVPLVFALAGNGTWLVYLIALAGILLIAACISRFGRYSASPGSLYKYATESLPPWAGTLAAWSLLLAYIGTGASVAGGFVSYARLLLISIPGHAVLPPVVWAVIVVGVSTLVACSDVQVSTRLMLWIEASSALLIGIVLVLVLVRQGLHPDHAQLRLQDVTPGGIRLGLVLALFSFVGFESATTLGHEVKDPLRTIPRAVVLSAVLGGAFFTVSAYTETLGFNSAGLNLGASDAPFHVLSTQSHIPVLGILIDIGVFTSLFACTLACITAAARVMLVMAHNGIAHQRLCADKNSTRNAPVAAVIASGILVLLPVSVLVLRGVSGVDIYGWMGSLATYGFLTAYALACIALPFFLKRRNDLSAGMVALSTAAVLAILLALVGTLYPVPAAPYNRLPYIYLLVLAVGLVWSWLQRRKQRAEALS